MISNIQSTAKKDLFYSKVMLFGEYSIILGSKGLTIPYSHFNGQLCKINSNSYTDLNFARYSNNQIKALQDYLAKLIHKNELNVSIDYAQLSKDLESGLFFESSIPEGYGLGSSGAMVAALYNEYAINKIEPKANITDDELIKLKQTFAQIESFYHGTSSGIDPLICYLKRPIVIDKNNHVESVKIPQKPTNTDSAIFLVDAETTGKTAPLVNLFMQKLKEPSYKSIIHNQLIPLTNNCIDYLLSSRIDEMFIKLKQLSELQISYFIEMIPSSINKLWKHGYNTDLFTLKLCGSGGGGFFLGFTRQYQKTKEFFQQNGKTIIPVYHELKDL